MAFDTPLSPTEETSFQAWKARTAPQDSGDDYDLRGAFKAGVTPDPQTGHWPDTYKKPNHPTFSTESMYAKDAPELAGSWDGQTYVPPKKQQGYVPDDQEAATLLDAVTEEKDPKRRDAMVGMLSRYRSAKVAKGEPLFQPDAQTEMKQTAGLESMFSGIDKMDDGLEPAQKAALKVAVDASADAPSAKARMANQAYVLAKWPDLAPQVDADWTSVKHAVAKQLFGDDSPDIPENVLYSKIGGKLTKDKAERGMLTDVLANVQLEAAKGNGDWIAAWQKASKGMTAIAGYTPANLDHYRNAAKQVFADSQASLAELSPAIAAGKEFYRLSTAPEAGATLLTPEGQSTTASDAADVERDTQTTTARQTFLDELLRLPEAKRQAALNFAIAGAADIAPKPMGEEGNTPGWIKAAESYNRGGSAFLPKVGSFAVNASRAGAELLTQVELANSSPEHRDLYWGTLKKLHDDQAKADTSSAIDDGLNDAVDPIRSKNRLAQGIYATTQAAPLMIYAAQPEIGFPMTLMALGEDNRKQFVAAGVPPAEAATLALAAAAPQAAMFNISSNMALKGTLPGLETWLSKAVGSKLALARKMVAVGGVEMTYQNIQQNLVNITPAVYQEMASVLDKDVPGLKFGEEMAKFKNGSVDTFYQQLPLVLLGTGMATFKEAAFGRQYLSNKNVLKAAGFTDDAAERISQTAAKGDLQQAQALVQSGWKDEKVRPAAADEKAEALRGEFNNEEQKAAFDTLESDQQESTRQITNPDGARATRNEDGSWTVIDGRQQYVDTATTPEHAMGLVRDVDAADSKNLSAVLDDTIDYFKQRGTGAPIEKTGDMKFLQDKVDTGTMTQDAADRIVKLYADLGVLPKNTTPSEARIYGESAKLYNARTKLYDRIIRLHDGADPLTLIEEEAETYVHQSVANGDFTHEDIDGWRRQVEGDFTPQKNAADRQRSSVEWFSKYAQAYFTGKAPETAAIPFTVKRWLDKMKKVFADTFTLARQLIEQEGSGKLPVDFRQHLARSVGLDDAFLEKRGRDEARAEAYAPEPSRYNAREAFHRIKLPTPKAESSGMKGELANLWESMKFNDRMKLFSRKEGSLDQVAEALRADYGFSKVLTGDDVVKLAEATFLRNEEHFSDKASEQTFDVRGKDEKFVNVDQLPGGDHYTVVPKGDPDPLAYGQKTSFWLSPDSRWIGTDDHERGASEMLGEQENPEGKLDLNLSDLMGRGWVRVVNTGDGKGDPSPLYFVGNPSPSQIRELKNVAIEYGRTLTQDLLGGRQRILWAPDESTLQLRKAQVARDQTENLFKEEELPFNLEGEAGQDHTGAMDRELAKREAVRKQAQDQGDLWAESRAQPDEVKPVKKLADGAQLMGPTSFQIRAYHGTPHDVDRFTTEKIGTGEGAQAYGWGLYFAQQHDTAEAYRQGLSNMEVAIDGKRIDMMKVPAGPYNAAIRMIQMNGSVEAAIEQTLDWKANSPSPWPAEIIAELEKLRAHDVQLVPGGNTYTVDLLPAADDFLHWDKPMAEQSDKVKAAIREMAKHLSDSDYAAFLASRENMTGAAVYRGISAMFGEESDAPKETSAALAKLGVPGIRYLDEYSRTASAEANEALPIVQERVDSLKSQLATLEKNGDEEGAAEVRESLREREAQLQSAKNAIANLTHNFVLFDHDLVKIVERNGKPVAEPADNSLPAGGADATMQLRAQTRTPEFRKWFGESKAVDEEGEPLVLYHGGNNPWTTFDKTLSAADNDFGRGIYMSTDRGDAEGYDYNREHGAPNVTPLFASLKKPLMVGGPDETVFTYKKGRDGSVSGALGDLIDALFEAAGPFENEDGPGRFGMDKTDVNWVVENIEDAMKGRKSIKASELHELLKREEIIKRTQDAGDDFAPGEVIRAALQSMGFDGVIDSTPKQKWGEKEKQWHLTDQTKHVIAFDPTQIKSAIGNRGTFDASNPDITMDLRKVSEKGEEEGVKNFVSEKDGAIRLHDMRVPADDRGQGKGTAFMQELVAYADKTGQRIILTPSTDFGGSSVARLTAFYKRFGFVENRGANKDFSTMESMVRPPMSDTMSIGRANRADDVAEAMRPRMIGLRVQASETFADQVKTMLGQPEYAVRGMSVNEREARKVISDHGADLGRLMSTLSDPTQSMHPATKVALGFFIAEAANKAGDYKAATAAALWSAEYATSTGQAVNEFKRWSIFSNPETAQHLLQTQIEKENARRNEKQPALAAVADTYAEVQKQARKLLKTWLDEINDVDATKVRPISRQAVGALPDVTFSLRPDILGTGIVTAVAKMLKQNGAEATEAALLERYGAQVEKHIPDILIEAQRELMGRKRETAAGKKSNRRIPDLGDAQIEQTLAGTRGKQETQLGLPNAEELKARGMSDEEIQKAMDEAGAKGSQSLADMPELYDRLLEHLMSKVKEKGISVPKGIYDQIGEVLNRQGLAATPDDVKRLIGVRQLIPDMTPEQAERLAGLARNIASTPLGSFERSMQTMHLFSYVHDQIAPHDVVDVAFGLWYANVLSGIMTSARNITGNASMLFLDQAAETIFRNPKTYFPYLKQLLRATQDSWGTSTAQGENTMKRGQEGPIKSMSQGDERRQGVLESKTAPAEGLRSISRLATRSLSVQDLFFANTAFEMKARQLAWDQAKKEAAMGRLSPEEIEGRVDRLLNQATDQIQTFEDRAQVEWQNLDPEVSKEYDQANWEKRRVKELQMFEREKTLVARAVDFAQRVTLDYEPEGLTGLLMTNLSRVFAAAEHAAQDVQNTPGRLLSKSAAKFARVMIIPFMRVPVNIFNRALDYGPVGYGRALMDAAGIPVLVGGSGKTRVRSADERSDLLKRATVGTLAMLPLAILCRPRGPDDDDGVIPWLQIHGAGSGNPQTNLALNGPKYRPYSLELNVGGVKSFVDYRMLPLAPYLAAIGTIHDRTRYAKNKTLDEKSGLIQAWIIGQALKESMMSSSPITSLRELSEAAAENSPMSERSVNRVLARSTVGIAANMIPLSGLWRSLDQLVGGNRNTRDTLMSAAMAEVPVAGRLNLPTLDALGDPLTTRTGIGWLADWSKMETPESRIYATFARKGITPGDIARYQTKMTPEMFYEFAKARGQMLKATLLTEVEGKTALERLDALSSRAPTLDGESAAKRFLDRVSRSATLRALAQVGFKDPGKQPTPPPKP